MINVGILATRIIIDTVEFVLSTCILFYYFAFRPLKSFSGRFYQSIHGS